MAHGAAADPALYGPRATRGPSEALLASQATRNERVDHCLELISRGEWSGLRTQRALSRQWGCSLDAMASYAREAFNTSRRLAMLATPEQREEMRCAIIASSERIRDDAHAAGEYADALRANELLSKLYNLLGPDVQVNVAVQAAALTDEQLEDKGAEWLAALEPSAFESLLAKASRIREQRAGELVGEVVPNRPALPEASSSASEPNDTGRRTDC